jgi:hypothetical protein
MFRSPRAPTPLAPPLARPDQGPPGGRTPLSRDGGSARPNGGARSALVGLLRLAEAWAPAYASLGRAVSGKKQ